MDFVNSIKQAIEIVKLNGKAAKNVSKDNNATLMGILIIAIGGFLSQILSLNIINIISTTAVMIFAYFFYIGIVHLLALLSGGQAKYMEYFRAESHAAILGWLGLLVAIIPFLKVIIGILTTIWGIVVSVVILENVHKLTRGKAIVVVLLPVIVLALLIFIGASSYFGDVNPNALMP